LVVSPPRDLPIACEPFFSRAGTVLMGTPDGSINHHVLSR
jgi:hypothetical protein